jgi:hypothetical protein
MIFSNLKLGFDGELIPGLQRVDGAAGFLT